MDRLSEPFFNWLVELRRGFHRCPELQYKEEKTAAMIALVLESLGVPFQTGIGGTGIVAALEAQQNVSTSSTTVSTSSTTVSTSSTTVSTSSTTGPTVAFRADMDALPVEEANEVPYKSEIKGRMHACGHDAHITIALGIIRWLTQEQNWRQKGSGRILFIFQPAEEGGAGAKAMLDSGFFDTEPVEAVFAGHVYPDLPAGHAGIAPEISNAATNTLRIRLKGKGGHGAYPHQCNDPIVAGAWLVTQLQTLISRNLPPLESAVLTIGQFHAGTASNIIPEEAFLEGTLRTLTPAVRSFMIKRIEETVKGMETGFGISADLDIIEGYPTLVNHPKLVSHIRTCAEELLGPDCVHVRKPSMGAEDFAYFCNRWGGVMVNIGCRRPQENFRYGLHSPHFDIDESVLETGTLLFGHTLIRYIAKQQASQ